MYYLCSPKMKLNYKSVPKQLKAMYFRDLQRELLRLNETFPVQTITGPRQSGKTTLCKMAFPDFEYFNLENPITREEVAVDLMGFVRNHSHGVIIDEAQNLPDIFSAVQVAVDEDKSRRYILTGSSNVALLRKVKQSLAGRTTVHTLLPLSLHELDTNDSLSVNEYMWKGFFPSIWSEGQEPTDVYKAYYQTYLQRDVTDIISLKNLNQFRRFVLLLVARVGTELNARSLAKDVGVSVATIQQWVSVLETSYIAFLLPPYFRNIGKRLIKAPKIYFYDTGLVCYLLGIHNPQELDSHPMRGAIFENLIVCEFIKHQYNFNLNSSLYFYRDNKKEVDLLREDGLMVDAYEIKLAHQDNTSFYGGLEYLRKIYGDAIRTTQVIYTGTAERHISDNGLKNYYNLLRNI